MKSLFLFSLFISSNFVWSDDRARPRSKTACDDSYECEDFTLDKLKAKCYGYFGCHGADINLAAALCSGDNGCNGASVHATGRVFCNGYKSCYGASSIRSTTDNVVCSGDRSCTKVSGGVHAADKLVCAGDQCCQSDTLYSGGSMVCSGFKACKGATITAGGSVYCDGDTGCSSATITANNMRCYGKRVCRDAILNIADTLDVYGFLAAAGSTITAKTVNAIGFNALAGATVDSAGNGELTVKAWGYRSAVLSTIICRSGDVCALSCKSIACKKTSFLCESGATCSVTPSGCQMDNSVRKIAGIICPSVTENATPPNIELAVSQSQYSRYEEESDAELDDMLEHIQSDDSEYEEIMALRDSYEDYMDPEDVRLNIAESMAYSDGGIANVIENNAVYSNLLIAVISSLFTFLIVGCYFKRKYGDAMYKPLDN